MSVQKYNQSQPIPNKVLDQDGVVKTWTQILGNGVSPIALSRLNQLPNQTTLQSTAVVNAVTIDVVSTTGFVDGAFIQIFNIAAGKFFLCRQIGAPSGNTITIDTPVPFAFDTSTIVAVGTTELAVNGSVTPEVFSVRTTAESLNLTFDVTRIIFVIRTATTPAFDEFGDLPALTNGVVCRKRLVDGSYEIIFNVKTNADWQGLMYDVDPFEGTGIFAGVEGISGRFTFERLGSPIRLGPGEDLEFVVQDNLTGLDEFFITAEGNQVEENPGS